MADWNRHLDRRGLLRWLGGSAALAAGLGACGNDGGETAEELERLAAQRRFEQERSGQGPWGELRFRGYRGLAELPYFELDAQGRLRLATDDLPRAFDIHAHLGIAVLLAPAIDLARPSEQVCHLLDCDREQPGCVLDLDVYINSNFSETALSELRWELASQLLWGSRKAATHTIPNLLSEMDAMGVARAAILPIAFGLPFNDRLSERWLEAISVADAGERLLPGASVHPHDERRLEKLRGLVARGARILKLHPAGQRFRPDESAAMELYAECERLGIPVIWHAGRAGIEPDAARHYNLLRNYRGAIEAFPRVQFVLAHAGARDVAEALPLAQRHPHVWLGSHGQGVTRLHEILRRLGPERLLFGSDWPWYHLGASLAKLLLVTEGQPQARAAVLRGNAERLFRTAAASASTA